MRLSRFSPPGLGAAAVAYGAVGIALWPWPVVGLLHAEASAIVAATAFFGSALGATAAFRTGARVGPTLAVHLALLVLPWALLTASLLWRPNCAYGTGLALFVVMVPPSAVVGVALAYALTGVRRAGLWAVALGLGAAVGGVVADLALHPQLFTYNNVFGGVLGPVYDEDLAVRPGLLAFRALTLGWAVWLVCLGHWRRGGGRPWAVAAALAALVLGAGYVAAVPLGIQQTPARIARALGATAEAGPFRFVYRPDETSPVALAAIADEAQWRAHQLAERLGVAWTEPVTITLYPDPDTKGALVGSRVVSVTPVWLPRPQVHMLADEVGRSLGHELAHVAARAFGMPGLRASPAVGLVEGLAVAVEGPDGGPSAEALVAAARTLPGDAGGLDADPAAVVRQTMSPTGFWTARAAVAYTANGAFAGWLLDRYGAAPMRRAYHTGRFVPAYGVPLDTLAARWGRHLQTVPATDEARATAAWFFRQPSLFERRCPHHVPRYVRDTRDGWRALDRADTLTAGRLFRRARAERPAWPDAVAGLALVRAAGHAQRPVTRREAQALDATGLDSLATPAALAAVADLHRLAGPRGSAGDRRADTLYAHARRAVAPTDRWGRLVLSRRAALPSEALVRLRAHPGRPARAAAGATDPLLAAVWWSAAERPDRAWAAARHALAGPLSADERRTVALAAATYAYGAGALADAERLAMAVARASIRVGEGSQAAVAADLTARARWRRATSPPPVRLVDR